MTTITAMQALEALDELESSARGDEPFNHLAAQVVRAFIGNALAAPATAPDQPAWHDAPTCAGWWVCLYQGALSTAIFSDYGVENFDAEQMAECRWYGPIPQEKKGGAA